MMTPLDIQNKVFKKAFNGYDKADVDDFIILILADYEKVYKTSIEATDKINALSKLVDSYKAMEETMKESLLVAQRAADEVIKNAKDKAELVVSESELKAREIIAAAEVKVTELNGKLSELKTAMELYKTQAAGMLNAQIDVINKFKAE